MTHPVFEQRLGAVCPARAALGDLVDAQPVAPPHARVGAARVVRLHPRRPTVVKGARGARPVGLGGRVGGLLGAAARRAAARRGQGAPRHGFHLLPLRGRGGAHCGCARAAERGLTLLLMCGNTKRPPRQVQGHASGARSRRTKVAAVLRPCSGGASTKSDLGGPSGGAQRRPLVSLAQDVSAQGGPRLL